MDLLQQTTDGIRDRLTVLQPAVDEAQALEGVLAAFPARRSTPPAANTATTVRPRPGARIEQVFAIVRQHPKGIEAPVIASKCGMAQNGAYGPLKKLASQGKVRKVGKRWKPVAA